MPADPFKKALPGQRLVIPADKFNGFVDAANDVRARQHNTESEAADEGGTADDRITAGRFALLHEPLDNTAIGRGIGRQARFAAM